MTEQEKKMWQDDVEMIAMLNERNKGLQDRIDRAIEYIKQHIIATETEDVLLEILEGNNENIK